MCELCGSVHHRLTRRGLMAGAGAALAAAALPSTSVFAAEPPANAISPDEALKRLVEGNARYVVSGDRDLLDLKTYRNISLLRPAAFLKILHK